jgi:hypothetical protein
VGDRPSGLTFDGESIWVSNRDDHTVTKLALDGTELGTFLTTKEPLALAFDGNSIWVGHDIVQNTLTRLALNGEVLRTYGVYSGGELLFDGRSVWVASGYYGVTKVTLETR